MQNETFPPVATCSPDPTASMTTRRAATMTPTRATKRDSTKTMKATSDKKKNATFAASTMNTNQDDNATEKEISLVSPGAVPVPGTGSSLGPPNLGAENASEVVVPPCLSDQGQSLVILAAQLVTHHPDEEQQDQHLEQRIAQEVNSRLMERDPKIVVAEKIPPASTATDQPTYFRKKMKYVLLFVVLLGICGAIVGASISSGRSKAMSSPEFPSTASPSIDENPIASRTRDEETQAKIMDVLKRQANLTIDEDLSTDSPQPQALQWLLFNDTNSLRQNGSVSESVILERYVLAVLFYSTGGYSWQQGLQFLTKSHVCNWNLGYVDSYSHVESALEYGVRCLADAKVESITIPQNNLNRSIPSELSLLSKLRYIDLSKNNLGKAIPTELGLLTALEVLDVLENKLTGTLPTEVGLLTSMRHLLVGSNSLVGTLPTELGGLANLVGMIVASNNFAGWLPTELGLLTSLFEVDVSNNLLSGILPTELGLLTSLPYLDLSFNSMKGHLPTQLGNLNLMVLDLSNNQFTGTLVTELGRLTELGELYIANNTLTGTLSTELGNLGFEFALFDLSRNQFTGTLPIELCQFPRLAMLSIQDNSLEGTLPTEIGWLTSLTTLNVASNYFAGTLPTELAQLTALEEIIVNDNVLNGTIPEELATKANLRVEFDPQRSP